jgi:hypothetical protein
VREIQAHLEQLDQVEVSPSVISAVTAEVMEEETAWQQRPLDRVYPGRRSSPSVKIRDEGVVRNKAVYLALGIDRDGHKDVLGLWIEQTEGADFWLRVMTELKSRGVEDILIALVDGLVGFPDAITTVFPQAQVHRRRRASRAAASQLRELEGPEGARGGAGLTLEGRHAVSRHALRQSLHGSHLITDRPQTQESAEARSHPHVEGRTAASVGRPSSAPDTYRAATPYVAT